jgi:glutamate/tyrosine decarboxylase-like PLP-dependent enzyme
MAERSPVFFASEDAHASVVKGAMIAGLGAEGAIGVHTDSEGRLDPDDLHVRYEEAVAAGRAPFAVVATAGTTVTGSIDPIAVLGAFARERGLWFHVDAAWGGGLQLSDSLRARLDGIEAADSITFCPQKLLLVGLSSSVILFRDMDRMERAFRTSFPYVDRRDDFVNRCEIGVQGSRPAEVLKLWLTLQHVGRRLHGELVDRWVALADAVAAEVTRRPFLTLACVPQSGIVCFRGADDARTAALHTAVAREAGIHLSLVPYRGARWLRAVFANPFVEGSVVGRIFDVVDACAAI